MSRAPRVAVCNYPLCGREQGSAGAGVGFIGSSGLGASARQRLTAMAAGTGAGRLQRVARGHRSSTNCDSERPWTDVRCPVAGSRQPGKEGQAAVKNWVVDWRELNLALPVPSWRDSSGLLGFPTSGVATGDNGARCGDRVVAEALRDAK